MKTSLATAKKTLDQTNYSPEGGRAEEDTLDALIWIKEGVSEVLVARRWLTTRGDFRVDWCVSEELSAGIILYLEAVRDE